MGYRIDLQEVRGAVGIDLNCGLVVSDADFHAVPSEDRQDE